MKEKKREPFRMSLIKAKHIEKQQTENLMVFLVLNGEVIIQQHNQEHHLKQDDLLVINPFKSYEINSTEKNLFLSLQISSPQLRPHFEDRSIPQFDCDSTNERVTEDKFNKMREILAHLMATYFKNNDQSNLEAYQYLFALLAHLSKEFMKEGITERVPVDEIKDERLRLIINKIQTDYDQVISLESLSEESELSYYHLSRTFKKQIGMTFTEYLNQVRLIHATDDLLVTEDSIINVALNNGFSNVKHFHQVFKKQYDMTPANYRKVNSLVTPKKTESTVESNYEELQSIDAQQELAKYLVGKDIVDDNVILEEQLSLDVLKGTKEPYQPAKKIVKMGPAKEGLSNAVQQELRILQKELEFDYVEFEGFCEETNFEQDQKVVSEYLLNNQLFEFLVSINLTPMIQLCLPKDVKTLKEVESWCHDQLTLLRYYLNYFGHEEVQTWAIQWGKPKGYSIWDERSRFGYRYFYKMLRKEIGTCEVGLLTLDQLKKQDIQKYVSFLEELAEGGYLPNFICFQADPYKTSEIRQKYARGSKEYQQLLLDEVTQGITTIQNNYLAYQDWQPEIYLTDWNTLVGEGDTLAGTFFRAALILEAIVDLSTEVHGLAYWMNIKIKERQSHKREENSLSLFLYEELRRPLFFLLNFLNRMVGELIAIEEGYILTKSKDNYQLLLYNSSLLDPNYSVDTYQVSYQSKKLSIQLSNIPKGSYMVRHYTLDKDHGGIYNDWIRVGGQTGIDGELQAYLEQIILPKFDLLKEKIEPSGHKIDLTLTLNACQLYVFQKLY